MSLGCIKLDQMYALCEYLIVVVNTGQLHLCWEGREFCMAWGVPD